MLPSPTLYAKVQIIISQFFLVHSNSNFPCEEIKVWEITMPLNLCDIG